jgi:hypothetical protein
MYRYIGPVGYTPRAADLGPFGVLGQARGLSYARNLTPRSLPPQEQCSAPAP